MIARENKKKKNEKKDTKFGSSPFPRRKNVRTHVKLNGQEGSISIWGWQNWAGGTTQGCVMFCAHAHEQPLMEL